MHHERTEFQEIMVLDTVEFGHMLVLDDIIQTTEKDEFTYHELMSHIPLLTHPDPRQVLVIGGGDGGVIREILKHSTVRMARLVEIDQGVVDAARRHLPGISRGLADERCQVVVDDGIKHVAETRGEYDVIIVDSTDPIGPAVGLFTREFYHNVYDALAPGGLFVAQTESPFFNRDLITGIQEVLRQVFPVPRLYWGVVPTYPGGMWTFSMGSRGPDPLELDAGTVEERFAKRIHHPTRYVIPAVYRAAFALPPFVRELISP